GIFVQLNENGLTFVATDGHRLLRYRRPDLKADGNALSFIIPRKAFTLLRAALPADVEPQIEVNASNAYFTYCNLQMVCRLIDERFPDYESVIPVNNPNKLTIDRLDLLGS